MNTRFLHFLLPAVCLSALLAACAGPVTMSPQGSNLEIQREAEKERALAYKRIITDQDRVFNVSFPIMAANAAFCRNTAPLTGMTVWNLSGVDPAFRRAAVQNYNLQETLAVQFVADRSPAAKAGLQSGDFIRAVNGHQLTSGRAAIGQILDAVRQAGDSPFRIVVERNGRAINTVVRPVRACNTPVILNFNSSAINAYADGEKIIVEKGILRFTENDDELALVIAHELGHTAMEHIGKMKQNAIAGSLGGLVVDSLLAAAGVASGNQFSQLGGQLGAGAHSVAFEQEADYVGMYFMERAGYDSSGVADFWRRMAAENADSISMRAGHPTSPERFIAIERIHREIAAKKARGAALAPNIRPR